MLDVGVAVAAIGRLMTDTAEVHGLPVLIVSAAAALVMFAGAIIVGGGLDDDDGEDLNIKAVLLDTAADAAAAGGVAVTGAVILATHGWYWLDPTVAPGDSRRDRLSRGRLLVWRVVMAIRTKTTSQPVDGRSQIRDDRRDPWA